ncbi:hypothetical protein KM043_016178 [Ampulex compressa]|nr:hypothetical protein KM043_016178 [Ampulex compressa]
MRTSRVPADFERTEDPCALPPKIVASENNLESFESVKEFKGLCPEDLRYTSPPVRKEASQNKAGEGEKMVRALNRLELDWFVLAEDMTDTMLDFNYRTPCEQHISPESGSIGDVRPRVRGPTGLARERNSSKEKKKEEKAAGLPEASWTIRRGYYRAPVFLRGGPIGGPLSRDDCNTFGAA